MVVDASNIPIDIHCGKLLDWLLSRRHCNKEWQTSALKIREKIAQAIQDMPEHPAVTEMLVGTYITYSHCLKIIDVLKETEASSRNVFGRYSSQRMKDWQETCQLYEKENLYLAEMAQLLQQYVQYEVPAYKKQIAKCQQTEQECERKEMEYEKLAKESERQYVQCVQLHLLMDEKSGKESSSSIRVALLRSAECLPEKFDKITRKMKSNLSSILKYYIDFRSASGYGCSTRVMSMLSFVLEKGLAATVYEYKHGKSPTDVERVSLLNLIEEEEKQMPKEEIDFDIGLHSGGGIDFEIEAVDSGEATNEQNIITTMEETIARGDDALSIFEHRPSMQMLIADLRELQAFYKVRYMELRREACGLLSTIVATLLAAASQDDPLERLKHKSDLDTVVWDLRQIDFFIEALDDSNLKRLSKIRVSPQYLQSVADKVTEPLRRAEKYKQSTKLMKEQQEEARKQAAISQQKASMLAARAKELQKFLEDDVSKRYNNRPVKIVGSTAGL